MQKVFDIRGTHGSGKSTIVRELLSRHSFNLERRLPLTYEGRVHNFGYTCKTLNLAILGNYENVCGGCDGIKTQNEIKARVLHYLDRGFNVLLEGILVAHTYGPWRDFAQKVEEAYGAEWHFVFLNTDVEECVRRVNQRRAEAGKGPIEDEGNIRRDHHRIGQMADKFQGDGFIVLHAADYEDLGNLFHGN